MGGITRRRGRRKGGGREREGGARQGDAHAWVSTGEFVIDRRKIKDQTLRRQGVMDLTDEEKARAARRIRRNTRKSRRIYFSRRPEWRARARWPRGRNQHGILVAFGPAGAHRLRASSQRQGGIGQRPRRSTVHPSSRHSLHGAQSMERSRLTRRRRDASPIPMLLAFFTHVRERAPSFKDVLENSEDEEETVIHNIRVSSLIPPPALIRDECNNRRTPPKGTHRALPPIHTSPRLSRSRVSRARARAKARPWRPTPLGSVASFARCRTSSHRSSPTRFPTADGGDAARLLRTAVTRRADVDDGGDDDVEHLMDGHHGRGRDDGLFGHAGARVGRCEGGEELGLLTTAFLLLCCLPATAVMAAAKPISEAIFHADKDKSSGIRDCALVLA